MLMLMLMQNLLISEVNSQPQLTYLLIKFESVEQKLCQKTSAIHRSSVSHTRLTR